MNFNTAEELWEILKQRFVHPDAYGIANLPSKIYAILLGERSVINYFASLQTLWDEFLALSPLPKCVCEDFFCNIATSLRLKQQSNLFICFLKGLNGSFTNIKSQIVGMDPLPAMNKVFSLLLQFEREFLYSRKGKCYSRCCFTSQDR